MELITFLDWHRFTLDIYNQVTRPGFATVTTYDLYRFKHCAKKEKKENFKYKKYKWTVKEYSFVARIYGDRTKDTITAYSGDSLIVQEYRTVPDKSRMSKSLRNTSSSDVYNEQFLENVTSANLYIKRAEERSVINGIH